MSKSNSFDFNQNRLSLISDAFVQAGILRPEESPKSNEGNFAARTLNRMLKAFQADGLHLFAQRNATVFMEKDKTQYKLGPSGDNATESFSSTAIRIAAASTNTAIEVDTTVGMTASDYIGIEIDDGTMHWTTIASVTDSDTVVLTAGVDGLVSVDNVVYWYTNKIQRPLNIIHSSYHFNGNDTRMYEIAKSEYLNISDKNTETHPTEYYFDKQLTNAELNVFGEPNNVTGYIKISAQFPFDDMDSATDTLAFPSEWIECIHLGLSYRLATAYRPKDPKTIILKSDSEQALERVKGFDEERSDINIQPSRQWLRE